MVELNEIELALFDNVRFRCGNMNYRLDDLIALPLKGSERSLNAVAKAINNRIQEEEIDFVGDGTSNKQSEDNKALAAVKRIIKVRVAGATARQNAKAIQSEIKELEELLLEKESEKKRKQSAATLEKRLKELKKSI